MEEVAIFFEGDFPVRCLDTPIVLADVKRHKKSAEETPALSESIGGTAVCRYLALVLSNRPADESSNCKLFTCFFALVLDELSDRKSFVFNELLVQ